MEKFFSYNKSVDESFNTLVDCNIALARQSLKGNKHSDYEEKNAELIKGMGKKAVEGTRYEADFEAEGMSIFNKPAVKKNSSVRENFNAVIAQVINAVIPEVTNGLCGSFGTVFLFAVMPTFSRTFAISLPVLPVFLKSNVIKWFSVIPPTISIPSSIRP